MPITAESNSIADRFTSEIDDLRIIARLHGVPTGTPKALAALPLRLAQDSRLRSDLGEMVRSLQGRDPELALPDVLSLFTISIGGPSALGRNRTLEEAVDLTGGFLASLGGWPGADFEPITDLDNPPDHDPRLDLQQLRRAEVTLDDSLKVSKDSSEPQPVPAPEADVSTPGIGAITANSGATEIANALARLERGNLELRLHLDSIDQRISRMEPLLESVPHEAPSDQPARDQPTAGRPNSALPAASDVLLAREAARTAHPLTVNSPLVDSPTVNFQSVSDFIAPVASPKPPSLPASPITSNERPLSDGLNFRRITLAAAEDQSALLTRAERLAQRAEAVAAMRSANPALDAVSPPGISVPADALVPANALAAVDTSAVRPAASQRGPQPRRDRFAAAREIPGGSPDDDPLYNEPDAFEAKRSESKSAGSRSGESLSANSQPLTAQPAAALPSRAETPPASSLPSSPVAHPTREPQPLSPLDASSASTPRTPAFAPSRGELPSSRLHLNQAPLPTRTPEATVPRQSLRRPEPSVPLFGAIAPREMPAADDPPRSRRGPWAGAIAAALVLGASGFLYLNGLPSELTDWLYSSHTRAVSAPVDRTTSPSIRTQQPQQPPPSSTVTRSHRSPSLTSRPPAELTTPASTSMTTAADLSAGRTPGARQPSAATELTAPPTFVPGPVMDGHLVSAPQPEYPRVANFVGLEGKVTLEAMISKDGGIEALTVLGGNHLLRDAALNAVRQWQYRPFLVKGQPVEVRTIIRVDVTPPASAAANN